jgi:tRNA threonylcarbamoyladenosine biosynthesis protein TsaB
MRVLALETTEAIGSVAASVDGNLLAQLMLDSRQRTAQAFAPALRAVLEQVGWQPREVELVGVTVGPGSFTGLRIGITAAKTFAYAAKAEILGIDTLEAVAAAAPEGVKALSAAVDAQRGDVVAGSFRRGADGWFEPLGPSQLMDAETWLRGLALGAKVQAKRTVPFSSDENRDSPLSVDLPVLSGPALRKLAARVPQGVQMLDQRYWAPTAAAVAQLAAHQYAAGRRDDVWTLLPHYSRRSAAEEKWEAKEEGLGGEGIGDRVQRSGDGDY